MWNIFRWINNNLVTRLLDMFKQLLCKKGPDVKLHYWVIELLGKVRESTVLSFIIVKLM